MSVINSSKSRLNSIITKNSLSSRTRGSLVSVHGSRFGRSVLKSITQNDPNLMRSLSTNNSRVIRAVWNFYVQPGNELPDLRQSEATDCIKHMGKALNIEDYEFNYVSFWLLDILAKLIKDLQLKNVSHFHQNICLAWFRYVLRTIAVTGVTREEIFCTLQEMFKNAVKIINEGNPIPYPENLKLEDDRSASTEEMASNHCLSLKSDRSTASKRKRSSSQKMKRKWFPRDAIRRSLSKSSSKLSEHSASSLKDAPTDLEVFYTIIEMIYQVFGDRFAHSMVNLAYSTPNQISPVEIYVDFKEPKQLKPKILTPPPTQISQMEKGKKKKSSTLASRKGSPTKFGKRKGKKPKGSSIVTTTGKDLDDVKVKGHKFVVGKEANKEKDPKSFSKRKTKKSKTSSIVSQKGKKSRESSIVTTTGKDLNDVKVKGHKLVGRKEANKEKDPKPLSKRKTKKSKTNSIVSTHDDDEVGKENKINEDFLKNVDLIEEKNNKQDQNKETSKSSKKLKKKVNAKAVIGESKNTKKRTSKKSIKNYNIEKGTSLASNSLKVKKRSSSQPNLIKAKSKKSSVKNPKSSTEIKFSSKIKLFERAISPEICLEKDNDVTKEKYMLPLSEAVSKHFVENLLKTLISKETTPVEDIIPREERKKISNERKKSNKTRKPSIKSRKKGKKK